LSAPEPTPAAVARARRRRLYLLLVSAIVVAGVVVLARDVLLPFVLALVLAYVLKPLVAWVELRAKVPRGGAIVLVYVVVLGSLWLFVRGATPRISQELMGIRREVPVLVSTVRDEWVPVVQDRLRAFGIVAPTPSPVPELPKEEAAIVARPRPDGTIAIEIGSGLLVSPTGHGGYAVTPARVDKHEPFEMNKALSDLVFKSFAYAETNALEVALIGRNIVTEVSRAIFVFGITLMLAAYLMLTRDRILRFFTLLMRPHARNDFTVFLVRVDRGLSGVVRGQLTISLINGVLSAVGFAFVGLKYWPVLALVATIFSLIPIFGSIASAIPAVALGLTQSVGTAVFVLVWIVGIHQLEANILNPKIMGDAAKIHPVLVIFSLLVGEHFFHLVGALLAVPCMSIAQTLFQHLRDVIERDDPEFAGDPRQSSLPPGT
jgi:predicted PurR-regulated permease PerM